MAYRGRREVISEMKVLRRAAAAKVYCTKELLLFPRREPTITRARMKGERVGGPF